MRSPSYCAHPLEGRVNMPQAPLPLEGNWIVNLTAFQQAQDGNGFVVRLFHPTEQPQKATLRFENAAVVVAFGPFEMKSLRCAGGMVSETDLMEGLLDRV